MVGNSHAASYERRARGAKDGRPARVCVRVRFHFVACHTFFVSQGGISQLCSVQMDADIVEQLSVLSCDALRAKGELCCQGRRRRTSVSVVLLLVRYLQDLAWGRWPPARVKCSNARRTGTAHTRIMRPPHALVVEKMRGAINAMGPATIERRCFEILGRSVIAALSVCEAKPHLPMIREVACMVFAREGGFRVHQWRTITTNKLDANLIARADQVPAVRVSPRRINVSSLIVMAVETCVERRRTTRLIRSFEESPQPRLECEVSGTLWCAGMCSPPCHRFVECE